MLLLLFQLGKDRYALNAGLVAEVLPLVDLKQIPMAPPGVAGVMNYRSEPVPVIDLSALALGHPSPARLSTRIVMVNYPLPDGATRLVGLMVERATETLRREAADFSSASVTVADAPFLGPVTQDERGLIQLIEVDALLPASVREALFKKAATASAT